MRLRLKRLDELYRGYSIYFITCCCHERQSLLANPVVHDAFRHFCDSARQRHVLVGRYVMMPDHIHFFVHPGDDMEISLWMKSFKNSLSKTFRQLGKPSPHWQKGYFDHVARSEQSYEEKWIYVRENPVRKGLVSEADAWSYQGEMNLLPFH